MTIATRTLNPLPLEHLEPHRFEDLVRQLLYDFKAWHKLEPTGRSGSDDGFDVRAYEIVSDSLPIAEEASDEDDVEQSDLITAEGRVWLIQCKREKAIGPSKLVKYVNEIPEEEAKEIYGVIVAAACEFSKKARDEFRRACVARGFKEWHLWSRTEIEDMLFRPANDHLLFAYFGISIQVRKRSIKAQISSRLTTKRRIKKYLLPHQLSGILIRDAHDTQYPYIDEENPKDHKWRVLTFHELAYVGAVFTIHRRLAYISEDGKQWDYVDGSNTARVGPYGNPWYQENKSEAEATDSGRRKWLTLPEVNRAHFELQACISLDNIVAIDEMGDDWFEQPHVFVNEWTAERGPFDWFFRNVEPTESWSRRRVHVDNEETGRVDVFSKIEPPSDDQPIPL